MAVILNKSAQNQRSYSYSKLAALYQRAANGDTVAVVKLAELPAPEQRLARQIYEAFGGKAIFTKSAKPKKSRKPAKPKPGSVENMWRHVLMTTPDPAEREAARAELEKLTRA